MRKTIFILIIIILCTGLLGCRPKKQLYNPGEYVGVGEGHHGPIRVIVTTDEYSIIDILVIEEYEMPELAVIVYDKIPKKVIKTNNANVDVVAGASYTSVGLIEAINDGLNKALIAPNK